MHSQNHNVRLFAKINKNLPKFIYVTGIFKVIVLTILLQYHDHVDL